jgi:DNA-binding beta-propeller fold protein YncE
MLVVLDAASGRRIATVPIGNGVDGAEYDEARGRIFAPSGEGTLTVIAADGPDGYRVVENVATERGARTLALDPSTGTVYLPTADFGPPPEPTADRPHPRPSIVPGTFRLLVVKP